MIYDLSRKSRLAGRVPDHVVDEVERTGDLVAMGRTSDRALRRLSQMPGWLDGVAKVAQLEQDRRRQLEDEP